MEVIKSSLDSSRITLGNWDKLNNLMYSTQPISDIKNIDSLFTNMLCKSFLSMESSIFKFIDFTSTNHKDQVYRYIILKYLAEHGNAEIMDWLSTTEFIITYDGKLINTAILHENLEILRWYNKHFKSEIYSLSDGIVGFATVEGKAEVINWVELEVASVSCWAQFIDVAVMNGHLNVIKWFHEHNRLKYSDHIVDYAAKYNHVHILEWLHDNGYPLKYTKDAFNGAAECGYFAVLEWFIEKEFELKYTWEAIANLISCDEFDILDKISNIDPKLDQFQKAYEMTLRKSDHKALDWFKKSKLSIKCRDKFILDAYHSGNSKIFQNIFSDPEFHSDNKLDDNMN